MGNIVPIKNAPGLPPGGKPGGIGEKAENALVRFFYRVFDGLKDQISDLFRHAVDNIFENLERPAIDIAGPFVDRLLSMPDLPPDVRRILESARSGQHQIGIMSVVAIIIGVVITLGPAAVSPLSRLVQYVSNHIFKPMRLPFDVWRVATLRDPGQREQMLKELNDQGWTNSQVATAEIASQTKMGINDWLSLYVRGEITDDQLTNRARVTGFDVTELPFLRKLTQQIPGPGDQVRFSVREAYDEEKVQAYGYDSGFPVEFADWMEKLGYDRRWALYYWRSHWELPSVQMGFELLQRQIITRDELRSLMRALDIAPGWIEKLISLSYKTYTRVDTRRMYAAGVLNEQEVVKSYLDQGYSSDHAQKLALWTIQDAVNEEAGLTRASVQKSYAKGRLTRQEAIDLLVKMGTSREVSDFILEQADLDREDDLLDREIDTVGKRFKNGQLSESTVYTELGKLGVQGEEVRVLVAEWKASRSSTVRRPSKADLERFFDQGVLDLTTYRDQLGLLGYDTEYVAWYVASLAVESQQEKYDQAEKARKEQDRVDALRKKTDLQIAKARIDFQIAELKATIADAQVALVATENERDQRLRSVLPDAAIAEIKMAHAGLLNAADAAIAQAQVQISELNGSIGQDRTRISEIAVSLSENRDYVLEGELKAQRLTIQTDQARLSAEAASIRTEIARLKQAIEVAQTEEQQSELDNQILALQTQIAELNETIAVLAVSIREIDEQLPVTLNEVARSELVTEQARLNVSIRESESLIDTLQTTIRQAQAERLAVEQDMQADLALVPGRVEQIAITAKYATEIDNIEARIVQLRARIRELQVEKTGLTLVG